ncbi:DUF4817 domain-containing protein [Trichonephila clavipes]|nr:DUF4817 domain-containing protein [Trichonephila clavipes]
MLSAPDKALLVKLFYMNEESATIALRKFRVQKNVKSGKGPLTPAGLLKLVKRFEETGKLEDRARAGRPCLKEARAPCIAVEMEAIASEAASGTNSAREAARRLGLPPSSFRNILRRILQLYPYKLQLCHELLPADTAQRQAFAKWAFSKMEQDPTWVFNILWTDEKLISRFMVTLTTITVAFGRPLIPVPMAPRSPDLTPADFWLWGYLKSRVYLSGPSSLLELKDAIRREVSSIHPDMLHSAVAGFVTRLECLLPCGGGHVEHILDEVEKLAYQLNEEAEWTERPIRRLSKVMYGSTCADMQVDVKGECLSSIKHVVGTTSGCFYPRSNHWEVGGRPQCDKCGCRVRNCSQHRFTTLEKISNYRNSYPGFSSGRSRRTTPADDRYIFLQARRNRRQTAGEIARHKTQATGRPISRFTVVRRLHGGGLFARRPVRCVPLTPAHRRRRSLWCREHRNWRDNEWGRVLFTDESRFSL